MSEETLLVALDSRHRQLGARMVPFAGYMMPLQYSGMIAEHMAVREQAGVFDVSHMGQCRISGADAVDFLQRLLSADIAAIEIGQSRYSFLLNEQGYTLDDLIVARDSEHDYFVVFNASRKHADLAWVKSHLGSYNVQIEELFARGMLLLSGPLAADAIGKIYPAAPDLPFMHSTWIDEHCRISRSGYTGEDSFEISVPAEQLENLHLQLLADEKIKPVGLGARDSLRLEAGLCLYGHELSEEINPLEAGLIWAIAKHRRQSGGFIGDKVLCPMMEDIANNVPRRQVALLLEGKRVLRQGDEIFASTDTDTGDTAGRKIGVVTSGIFSPCLQAPIALALIERSYAKDVPVIGKVRNKEVVAKQVKLPFVEHHYRR